MFNLNYSKKYFILSGIILPFTGIYAKQKEKLPNIVIVFPDQFRQNSLGFWSQKDNDKYIQGKADPVNTPALDKLANEGVVFSRVMSNFPLSSPFRGMMLSGMYPDRNGLTANCEQTRTVHLNSDAICLSDILAKEGYETAYFGKCHWQQTEPLYDKSGNYVGTKEAPGGYFANRYDTYVPPGVNRHGFKYFYQTMRDTHNDPLVYSSDSYTINGLKDGELYQPKQFSAKVESEVVLDYLNNVRNQRDTKKPFLMVWALNPPHNPWDVENTDMEFFPQYTESGKVNIDHLLLRKNADKVVGDYAPYYFANVSADDYYIGKVLENLKAQGLDKNTIIIFCSDHGEMLGSHGLRGKNTPEVEAFNIPFIIKWDGKLKHKINTDIISTPDIMPTLLGLIGLESKIPNEVQGKNYASLIKPSCFKKNKAAKSALYIGYHARGVYTGKYTFVVNEENGKFINAFLYDNEKDPYQLQQIPDTSIETKLLASLKSELAVLLKSTEDSWYTKKMLKSYLPY